MSVKEDIKNQLTALLDERGSLLGLLDKLEPARILAFGTAYQAWYTRAVTLVRSLAPDRLDEFIGYYRVDPKHKTVHAGTYVIQDYINGYGPPSITQAGSPSTKRISPAFACSISYKFWNPSNLESTASSRMYRVRCWPNWRIGSSMQLRSLKISAYVQPARSPVLCWKDIFSALRKRMAS